MLRGRRGRGMRAHHGLGAEIAEYIRRGERRVVVTRETRETRITVRLDLDGRGFSTCGTAENEMAENGTTENGTEGRPENTAGSRERHI